MQALLNNLRYSLRSLWKAPAFTLIAVATVGSGIAAAALVFSVFNAVLLRTPPYPQPGQLLMLHWFGYHGQSSDDISAPAFFLVRDHASSFQGVAAMDPINAGINFSGVGQPRYVRALRVSAGFFRTLGIMPVGRDFTVEEDQPGGPRSVIIGYGLWERDFGKDPGAIGHQFRINNENYTVTGIMPREFRSYPEADLWVPLQLAASSANPGNDYRVIVRVKDSVTQQQARQELEQLSEKYRGIYSPHTPVGDVVLTMSDMQDFMTSTVKKSLVLLLMAVGFVLLIAVTNAALLIIVRALGRSRELATRVALGGGRGGLISTFFTDSILVTMSGAVAGIVVAKETIPVLQWLLPEDIPLTVPISIDRNVLLFALLVCFSIFLLLAVSPALKVFRTDPGLVLRQSSYSMTGGPGHMRVARIMIAAQTALTLVLLTGTGILLRNFVMLVSVSPGFDPRQVTVAQFSLDTNRYLTSVATAQVLDKINGRIADAPGVEAVAAVAGLPLEKGLNLPMHPTDAPTKVIQAAEYRTITPGYFRVMRVPVVSGRSFSDGDDVHATPVAMINETLARLWWPNQTALGKFVLAGQELGPRLSDAPRLIVGVLSDIRESGLDQPAPPTLFVPAKQVPNNITRFMNQLFLTSIVVRTRSETNMSEAVRRAVASADPDLPLAVVQPLSQTLSKSLARPRFYTLLSAAFAIFALLLTATGVYGLLSYQISHRVREIALRMALGGRRIEVVRMVIMQGVRLIALGVGLGMVAIFVLERLFHSMFYNIPGQSGTLSVLVFAAVLIGVTATLASGITAFRAASIEPMAVLRNE